jgi:hypothetical protein
MKVTKEEVRKFQNQSTVEIQKIVSEKDKVDKEEKPASTLNKHPNNPQKNTS